MECQIEVDSYDGMMAKFSSTTMRVARRQHKCQECLAAIEPGESYEINRGLWDDEWSTFKTCSVCLEIRKHLFCSWIYGCMWEDLAEELRWDTLDLSGLAGMSKAAMESLSETCDRAWEE